MYKFPCTGTTDKYFNLRKVLEEKFLQIQFLHNLLDIFSRIDESKKFCELKFYEYTHFYIFNGKIQEITLVKKNLWDKLSRVKNFKTFAKKQKIGENHERFSY